MTFSLKSVALAAAVTAASLFGAAAAADAHTSVSVNIGAGPAFFGGVGLGYRAPVAIPVYAVGICRDIRINANRNRIPLWRERQMLANHGCRY